MLLITVAAVSDDTPQADPDKDPEIADMLKDARQQIANKKPASAIESCDKVMAAFKARYGNGHQKIYCACTQAECLGYLLKASLDQTNAIVPSSNMPSASPGKTNTILRSSNRLTISFDKTNGIVLSSNMLTANPGETSEILLSTDALTGSLGNKNAIVLSSKWANAYFLKGYALQDLRHIAEAKSNIELALELSPCNSQYLSELGAIFELEKNWPKAKQQFESAEDNAALAPEKTRADELGRARRGLAYVFVELGKLDEAEKKYQQCLATDPNDKRAKRELKYVQGLRAKDKSPSRGVTKP